MGERERVENNQHKGANDILLYIKPEMCFFFKGFSRRRYGGMSARQGWRWVGVVSFKMTIVADTELVIITRLQAPVDSISLGEVAPQPPARASREPQHSEHSGREHMAAGESGYLAQLTPLGSDKGENMLYT